MTGSHLSRRQLFSAAGAAAALGTPVSASAAPLPRVSPRLVTRAASTKPAGSDLGAIDHVVFLMMENRSYDHYFGAYPRGRGFDDHPKHSLGAFEQHYPAGTGLVPRKRLLPFELPHRENHDCTQDLTHNWGPMHLCWNHGAMDRFVKVHTSSTYEGSPGGALTMGYYTRKELGFYWSLADHFTLCDAYHCSVLGPTHPNRLMQQTGTIDPAGRHGGPVTDTNVNPDAMWSCTWTTVQEQLEDAGVSWKVYHPDNTGLPAAYSALAAYPSWNPEFYDPTTFPAVMGATDHTLPYFKAFQSPTSPLHQKAFTPTFPNDFLADLKSGAFPSVSWIIPPIGFDEHPAGSPQRGMYFSSLVLDAIVKHPKVWAKTVVFVMHDENDGFFDHVPPPVPPHGTDGEWLTAPDIASDTLGIRGPIGLGVRVPCLVVSPFSRGGHVASEVFDHTSQLKFLHARFGVEPINVSKWRRHTVGDLTSTLFRSPANHHVPALPEVELPPEVFSGVCNEVYQDDQGLGDSTRPTIPKHQRMPTQHGTTIDPRSVKRHNRRRAAPADDQPGQVTVVPVDPERRGPRTSTVKARAEHLAADHARRG
jgi:phospholipase C